jgi:uncharacterized protein YlzI (FlbEa/FlbD family)
MEAAPFSRKLKSGKKSWQRTKTSGKGVWVNYKKLTQMKTLPILNLESKTVFVNPDQIELIREVDPEETDWEHAKTCIQFASGKTLFSPTELATVRLNLESAG